MNIPDDPSKHEQEKQENEKSRNRKKTADPRDAMAELQAAMRDKINMAMRGSQNPHNAPKMEEAKQTKNKAGPQQQAQNTGQEGLERQEGQNAGQKETPQEPKQGAKNAPPFQTENPAMEPAIKWLSPMEWTDIMLRIATRSQKIMQEFSEKNKTLPTLIPQLDPAHISQAFFELGQKIMDAPEKFWDSQLNFWQDYMKICQNVVERFSGNTNQSIFSPAQNDKRFQDPAWKDVWLFDYIKQSYLLLAKWAQGLINRVDGLDPKIARKIDFYTRQMVDAISPSNFWLTNPEVLRTTIETGGENLIKGFEHLLGDIERGQGQLAISMSDTKAFTLGQNIATTKGKVVFQNELIQLIQYEPLTEKAFETPLLIIPPWINKYYILDLREKNSFIRHLVQAGHTVFCISWVNPNETHAHVNFDDYMEKGLLSALDEIGRQTKTKTINAVGYCIGGTLLASTLAYLAHPATPPAPPERPKISSATYLVTMLDFSEPGDLGVFIDADQIQAMEALMEAQGYLQAQTMATTFNLLRANDLIWSFVVNNYLLGKEPFPFDLLYWNSDSTNLPAAMQGYYLRNMYMENLLIEPDALQFKNVPLDLRRVNTPAFFLSTRDDHIAPWRSTYAGTQIFSGPVTFTLSGSGHIAGVVNPPAAKKYGYWTNSKCPAHPEDWFKAAEQHLGSWWPEWLSWLQTYAGEKTQARVPANIIEDAPGTYATTRAV